MAADAEQLSAPGVAPDGGAVAFPTHALPTALRRFVEEGAKGIPCPPDFLALPALVVLASAIGATRELELRPGWRERPAFLAAIVADPGARKSPALALATRPLVLRQQELIVQHRDRLGGHREGAAHYEVNLAAWRTAKKQALLGKGEDPGEMPVRPEEPVLEQVSTSDVTTEALAVLLKQNPRGIAVVRDELTGWTRSMNAYRGGLGADRQAWLSLWSGAPMTVNRKGEPNPIIVSRPMVSVVGCLPPDVLGELSDERGRDDGFIHRLLFAFPAPVRLRWTEESIGDEALAAYCDLYKCLSSLAPHLDGEPVVTGFSPAGKIAFIQWVTAHYDELERVDEPLRGPWAKLEAYAARLALVIQEIRFVAGEASGEDVDAESVDAAAELIAFFKSSARPVYARLQGDPDDVRVARVVDWARRRTKTTLTAREIRRAKVGGVRTPADAQAVLLELAERGLGRLHRPGRGSIVFTFFAGPAGAGCQDDRLEAPKQTGTVVSAGATSVPEPLLPGDVAPSLPPTGTERCCAESPRGSHHPPHLAPGTRAVDDQKLGEGGRSPVPGDPGYLEWLGPTGARPITRRERRLQRVLHLYLVRCSAGVAAASKAVSENTARDQEA